MNMRLGSWWAWLASDRKNVVGNSGLVVGGGLLSSSASIQVKWIEKLEPDQRPNHHPPSLDPKDDRPRHRELPSIQSRWSSLIRCLADRTFGRERSVT
jgi:hypothetical protein